jgi:hypothetical protein
VRAAGGGSIAHLDAKTPFGFCTSAFLPIPPQTPKHLGFGVFMPSELRRGTLFVWSENACVMAKKKTKTCVPLVFGLTDFLFVGGHIFRQFKSRLMPPELPGCWVNSRRL